MIIFVCSHCQSGNVVPVNPSQDITVIKNDLSDIKRGIAQVLKEINVNSTEIKTHVDNKIVENTNELKLEYKLHKKSFADVVQNTCKVIPSMETINKGMKQALDSSNLASREQDIRDRSIMFFYCVESTADLGKDRKNDDISFVNDFVTEGLHIPTVDIESSVRIGRYEKEKSRPLKVTFTNRSDQIKVLKNLGNLKVADQKLKKGMVTMDRNMTQREDLRKLVKEAKEKSEASTDKSYVVRGSAFRPYIMEVIKNQQ